MVGLILQTINVATLLLYVYLLENRLGGTILSAGIFVFDFIIFIILVLRIYKNGLKARTGWIVGIASPLIVSYVLGQDVLWFNRTLLEHFVLVVTFFIYISGFFVSDGTSKKDD